MKYGFKKSGLTLIEVLVSISILALVFVTLASVMTKSLSVAQHSRQRAQANKILQDVNELIRQKRDSVGYDNFVIDCSSIDSPDSIPTPGFYQVGITPGPVLPDNTCDYKIKITTEVTWDQNTVSADTYYSKW